MAQNQLLPKSEVMSHSGNCYVVDRLLGAGTQGEVYAVTNGGQSYALKWYLPGNDTIEQHKVLLNLVDIGTPSKRFLWPTEVVRDMSGKGLGYVMDIRRPEFGSLVDLMKRKIDPSFRSLCTAGVGLADGFHKLHAKGLCYRDISFGNVFLQADSGEILICDNDNVAPENYRAGVIGTDRFMAPEIVTGAALPSQQTDLFSLSVLLFYMMVMAHPLEGRREYDIRCLDAIAMRTLYGANPVFIFDPNDSSNRPVDGYHVNAIEIWPLLPTVIQEAFVRAFTSGIKDPLNGRVRESEWKSLLSGMRDSILYCQHCRCENFYDVQRLSVNGALGVTCWQCHKQIAVPPRIRIDKRVTVMLNYDSMLYAHHTERASEYQFATPTAQVVQHPTNKAIWGLKNRSQDNWTVISSDGTTQQVAPDRSFTVANGVRVLFGKSEGEIRV
jgi:serine/threonine protein kinase